MPIGKECATHYPLTMRPDVVAFFDGHGLHTIAALVPTLGQAYLVIFLVGGALMIHRSRLGNVALPGFVDIWLAGGLGASLGARLYYLIIHGLLLRTPIGSWIGPSGSGSWGAFLGAILAIAIVARMRDLALLRWLDIAGPVAALGEVIGRIGCWLAGDDFGRITTLPWGIRFPVRSFAWQAQLERGEIASTAATSLPVHPQQFYLALNAAVLFVVLSAVWRRSRAKPGVTIGLYLLLYGASRFPIEFLRDPAAGGATEGLSSSQWMCLLFVMFGGAIWLVHRRALASPPTASPSPVPLRRKTWRHR